MTPGPTRVLCLEASSGGVVGGSLVGALELIGRLGRHHFTPTLILAESKDLGGRVDATLPVSVRPDLFMRERYVHPVRLVRAAQTLGDLVRARRAARRLLGTEQPGLVYVANGISRHLGVLLAARALGIPAVCHLKGFRRATVLDRLVSRTVTTAIAMTDEIALHHRRQGLRPGGFVTVPDGVDCASLTGADGVGVRRELGLAADVPVVGVFGHVQEWKGQVLALDAVARARCANPDLHCLIVGGTHGQGRAYAERLQARSREPDLAGHVWLLGERRDVAACFAAVDLVVHAPVRREPFGRVLIEAMALGRPLIAPREGGPVEIVADGETGLLVPPRDPVALSDALEALLRDPVRRNAMADAARRRVRTRFTLDVQAQTIADVFEGAVTEDRPSSR